MQAIDLKISGNPLHKISIVMNQAVRLSTRVENVIPPDYAVMPTETLPFIAVIL
jgi:hypothetical protein